MVSTLISRMKIEKLSKCARYWSEIFPNALGKSPFSSYQWFETLAHHLLHEDPMVLVFFHEDMPIAIAPMFIKENTLRFISDDRVTDYADVLIKPGFKEMFTSQLSEFISSENIKLDLYPVKPESTLVSVLPQNIDDITVHKADPCPYISLPTSWDLYMNQMNGKLRHELRRKMRKASNAEFKTLTINDIDVLFALMACSDFKKSDFLVENMRGFFIGIAQAFDKSNWLRFHALYLKENPIATALAFSFDHEIFLFNTGFDPTYADLSPGITIIGNDIKTAIEEGVSRYDFLRGDEEYKLRFGAKKRYTMRLTR